MPQRLSTSQDSLQKDGNRRIDSTMLNSGSTILSGLVDESDLRDSTDNSYETARTTSVAGDTSSNDEINTCRSSMEPNFIDRPRYVGFEPWSELDLTPSVVKDGDFYPTKNISKEGISGSKAIGPSSGINNRGARDVLSSLDNEANPLGNRTIKTKDTICKFIQDESMPEWAPSLCANSTLCISKYPERNDLAKFQTANTNVYTQGSIPLTSYKTPGHDTKAKIYRKTPLNIFQRTFRENLPLGSCGLHGSLDSTEDFEKLEKYIEGLPSSPANRSRKLRRSVSTSDISVLSRDKSIINYTFDYKNAAAFDTFDSHRGWEVRERQEPLSIATDRDTIKEPSVNEQEINEGELSTSLLIEWRKKRQRCFDTAMKMQEIVLESTSANKDHSKVSYPYVDPSNDFIKTITTSSEYQNCLASLHRNINFKPTEGSIADSRISFDKKSSDNEIELSRGRSASLGEISNNSPPALSNRNQNARSIVDAPKSPAQRAWSPGSNDLLPSTRVTPLMINHSNERITKMAPCQTESSPVSTKTAHNQRRKFFVTPGKPKQVKSDDTKRIFFPNINNEINKDLSRRVMKSLHAPGIYRLGYQTVISPVSMYIHGTDVNLIQNRHEKRNEMLLTPSKATTSENKLKFKLSGKTSTPRRTPPKNTLFADKEVSHSQLDANDESIHKPDFALPKATYRLPAQVRTMNENPTYNGGARTRGLLQSTENRLVIRHEGKRFGKSKDNREPESGSDSADMSIHVQKSAKKTNCMSNWK